VARNGASQCGREVPGARFDGTTIKVASLGYAAQVGTSQIGAKARIQRFNDDKEIKGVKLEYVGFSDDKNDPATALSEARKLVTQDQVFALVGDTSSYNPWQYFTQQKVPFFGWGFETAYCAPKPTTSLWGFGYNGCQVNPKPNVVVDFARQVYKYATEKLGNKHPTVAMVALRYRCGQGHGAPERRGLQGHRVRRGVREGEHPAATGR